MRLKHIFLALAILVAVPALAAPLPGPVVDPRVDPVKKPSRFSTGLILRGSSYETPDGQQGACFNPGLGITYSGTQNFSLALSADINAVRDPWGGFGLTLNSTAVGNKPGDNLRISVGVGAVHYFGTLPGYIEHQDSWRVPAVVAWVAARDKLKRPRLYAQGGITADPRNDFKRLHLAVLVPFSGGTQKTADGQ